MTIFEVANSVSIREIYKAYSPATCVNRMAVRGNVPCPFHGEDSKPSMSFHPSKNYCHCFACNKSYGPIDFVKEITGIATPYDAAKEICTRFNLKYDIENKKLDMSDEDYKLYKMYTDCWNYVIELYNYTYLAVPKPTNVIDYYKNRGITDNTVKKYKLGYCPKSYIAKDNSIITVKDILVRRFPKIPEMLMDTFGIYDKYGNSLYANRMIVPIFDKRNNCIGVGGRALDDSQCKYYNTPETMFFNKRTVLYNINNAKSYSTVYVVEGYFDALSMLECGINNVVATMGTAFTKEHIEILSGKEIILALDNDTSGKDNMIRIIESYPEALFKVMDIRKLNVKDMNEALQKYTIEFKNEIAKIKIVYGVEFALYYLTKILDMSCVFNREEYDARIKKLIPYYSEIARITYVKKLHRILYGKNFREGGDYNVYD